MRTTRLLVVSTLLLMGLTAMAQKMTLLPNETNTMFSLAEGAGIESNSYGTLYEDNGYLRIFTQKTSRVAYTVENSAGEKRSVYLSDYKPVVSDSVIDVIYPILKKAVAKKKKEVKKLQRKREKYMKNHPDEIDRFGGSMRSVRINIKDVKFMYASRSVDLLSDYNSDFWEKMKQVSDIIHSYVRGYSQEDVDEMTENGKFSLPFKIKIYKRQ
jgi:hypothetical protein